MMTSVHTRVGVIYAPPGGHTSPRQSCGRVQNGVVQPPHVCVVDLGEQIRYPAPALDLRIRVDVEPGCEDEGTLVRPRVRQGQLRAVAHHVTVDDDVQVERARPPDLVPDPPEDGLHAVAPLQDSMGGQRRRRDEHGIQVVGLRRATDRRGLVDRRYRDQVEPGRVEERIKAALQILEPVAEIAAERDRDPGPPVDSGGPVSRRRFLSPVAAHVRLRRIATVTSLNRWRKGAWGLWTVISTSSTPGSDRHPSASRWASVSMSRTGGPLASRTSRSATAP